MAHLGKNYPYVVAGRSIVIPYNGPGLFYPGKQMWLNGGLEFLVGGFAAMWNGPNDSFEIDVNLPGIVYTWGPTTFPGLPPVVDATFKIGIQIVDGDQLWKHDWRSVWLFDLHEGTSTDAANPTWTSIGTIIDMDFGMGGPPFGFTNRFGYTCSPVGWDGLPT